LENGKKW